MTDVAVVIPAGGKGRRMASKLPKQFLRLGGKPVLAHTIARFEGLREVREIIVVVPRSEVDRTRTLIRRGGFRKVTAIVEGGKERQDSVRNGLACFTKASGIVLVHDAVRPLVTVRSVRAVIAAARRYGAAVLAAPVGDTIKSESESRSGFFARTLPRHLLWAVQTPQGFRVELLRKAHASARRAGYLGTDDASLLERLGYPVRIVPGSPENIKITTPGDIALAEILLSTHGAKQG